MGVLGLWDLLAPVGRRVSVETLAGKKLAIDASIWMVQFMKAMRDEKGEMMRNAHILGFFRRICKLLFLRTKPVFVFDGGTPALKRRTVAARRRNRENAKAKIRKSAEKLLLNHLKAKKLEELALELKNSKQRPDAKGKQVMVDGESSLVGRSLEEKLDDAVSQEKLDEMLAASLAAEEEGKFTSAEPSSAPDIMEEENTGDEEEEMLFPVVNGNIDPTVLASLPPSMQLDLLVQMRERLMAENRQKYQKIKKMPAKFSELQIQSYLKTVAFRREIDEVQKSASGTGMGGVQTSRIASESDREFIFSSSFTGDKQVLKSAGVQNNGAMTSNKLEEQTSPSGSLDSSTNKLKFVSQACVGKRFKKFGDDAKTTHDERGHIQVSKGRGLGIHMTRDLQRNLALMKENEHDNNQADGLNGAAHVTNDDNIMSVSAEEDASFRHEKSNVCNEGMLEISFSKEDCLQDDTVDDLFSSLVAGKTSPFSMDITPSEDLSDESGFDIWEERKAGNESNDICMQKEVCHGEKTLEEDEVDWEEGFCNIPSTNFPCQSKNDRTVSRGNMEEESDLQEAIRRSLEDMQHGKPNALNSKVPDVLVNPSPVPCKSILEQSCSSQSAANKFDELVDSTRHDRIISPRNQFSSITLPEDNNNADSAVINEVKALKQVFLVSSDTCTEEKGLGEPCVSNVFDKLKAVEQNPQETNVNQNLKEGFIRDMARIVTQQEDGDDGLPKHGSDIKEHLDVAMKVVQNTAGNEDELVNLTEAFQAPVNKACPSEDQIKMQQDVIDEVVHMQAMKVPATSLDNEISHLRQEREQIGNEQRRLERNAESVSSEMFAECQELLQMFGLPYIIAPMEAEAQCAYMELINLVDGVVTDDSDVFLFGARSIYKNIFDDRKYVETYFMKDIETELGLTREKLICMALLLGSDYTEGVSGIGIVNAIEVLNAFPEDDGLQKFKEWVESPDPSILGKLDPHNHGSKRLPQTGTNDDELPSSDDGSFCGTCELNISDSKKFFMSKHRNISKNWHMPSSFPSKSVISAYATPQVDESTESFSWGKPDLPLLSKLCWERFGWSNQKADDLLFPVLKEYNKHETQLRLEAFYTFNERFAKIRSQRIKKAVKGITGNLSVELSIDPVQTSVDSQKEINSQPKQSQSEEARSRRNTRKQLKGNGPPSKSSEENLELLSESQNWRRGEVTKVRRSLRGRRKGKGIVGKEQNFDISESNSRGGERIHSEKPVQVTDAIPMPRRSARKMFCHKYTEDCSEADDLSNPLDVQNREEPTDVAVEKDPVDHGLVQSMADEISEPLEESFPMNHLSSGGGFCMDEDALSQEVTEKSSSAERSVSVSFMGKTKPSETLQKSLGQKPMLHKGPTKLVGDNKNRGKGSVIGMGKQNLEDVNCGTNKVGSTNVPAMCRLTKRRKEMLAEGNTQNNLAGRCGKAGSSEEVVVGVNDAASAPDEDNGLSGCRSDYLEESIMPTYLVSGGGFCNDGDENSTSVEDVWKSSDPGKAVFPTSKTRMASTEAGCNLNTTQLSSGEHLKPCSEKSIARSSPASPSMTEGKGSQRECGVPVLSAMPSLRRKRRKF